MQRSDGTTTVLTAFDQEAWNRLGVTWLASLRDLARYDGDVCVISDGLNERARRFLTANNVRMIPPAGKFKTPRLDYLYTAMISAEGTVAYWENTSYFQTGLDELFTIAEKSTVLSLSVSPQPMLRSSLEGFGYKDTDCLAPNAMHKTLLDIARQHGTVLQGQFIAGTKSHLNFLGKLLGFHASYGYLNDTIHGVDLALNLLYAASPDSFTIDSRWSDMVDSRWIWRGGLYKGDELVKVVSFPPNMVFSALCARFHLVNCYRELHTAWHTKYRDQFSMPRLLFARIKKEPTGEEATVQVRTGE